MPVNGVIAAKLDLLSRYLERVKTLLPMVRFQNFIVHRYEDVDLGALYGILTRHLDDFAAFMREIQDHVRRSG